MSFAVFFSRALIAFLFLLLSSISPAEAAPGFYVSAPDKKLASPASIVVMAYDSGRMVLSFTAGVSGAAGEAALLIPVSGFIRREQIHVTSGDLINRLKDFSALRLMASEDPSPCTPEGVAALGQPAEGKTVTAAKSEAVFAPGDYEIALLSAEDGAHLLDWLKDKGYRLPTGGENFLQPYIDQQFHFILAKINLNGGPSLPRPLQLAYNSPKFALPLRLAALSAPGGGGGEQDVLIFTLTRGGKVETANLHGLPLPEGSEVPEFVEQDFGRFAEAVFRHAAEADSSSAFLEFAGDAGNCPDCLAPGLKNDELRELGAFWLEADDGKRIVPLNPEKGVSFNSGVWLTRLHLHYRPGAVPDDLLLNETQDRHPFQPRFLLRKSWKGGDSVCAAAPIYRQAVTLREQQQAEHLQRLTGWNLTDIHAKMSAAQARAPATDKDWWKGLWKK